MADAFEEEEYVPTRLDKLQEKIIGTDKMDELTPLQQAEQQALEYDYEDIVEEENYDDDSYRFEAAIEEIEYEEPEQPQVEEYIDITKQAEITDNNGVIRDDVIDSILNDVDDLKGKK